MPTYKAPDFKKPTDNQNRMSPAPGQLPQTRANERVTSYNATDPYKQALRRRLTNESGDAARRY